MSVTPHKLRTGRAAAAAVLLAVGLAGCSSAVDHIPPALGGLPEGTPARPTAQTPYPSVHEPPARRDPAMSEAEAKRLREDLQLTRNKNAPPPDAAAGATRNP